MATFGKSLLKPAIDLSVWLGSRHCWHCGKQLQRKADWGYYFAIIKDPMGRELRVHKDCVKRTVGAGYVEATAALNDKG